MKHLVALVDALAYPVLFGGIVWWFRKQIGDLLAAVPSLFSRVSKIGPVELRQPLPPPGIAGGREDAHAVAVALPPAPELEPFEAHIREALQQIPAPARQEHLVRALAGFARGTIANQIFGTQFGVLRMLAANGPLPEAALNGLYQEHVRRATASGQTPLVFEAWINFLIGWGLVARDAAGRFVITDAGAAFLQFANTTGLTEAKAF
jgi:hypothetical protein